MKRIFVACAISVAFCSGVGAQGQPSGAGEVLKPYIQVKTIPGEERMVRVFFSPNCPYSKSYLQFFKNLASTLPASKTFAFTPLVNKLDGIEFSLAFYAVQRYYPAYVANFVEASLIGAQERSMVTSSWAQLDKIGKAARVPEPIARLVQSHYAEVQADVSRIIDVQHDLKVTNTPAVAVAGTYIVTPEFTSGDTAQFNMLVNAVISMAR